MTTKRDRKRRLILEALTTLTPPASTAAICAELNSRGVDVSERTIRDYVSKLREDGLTEAIGRKGHKLTKDGHKELDASTALDRVGFLSAKIDKMTYQMSFDITNRRGTVVVNTSLLYPEQLASCADEICKVFEKGYAMGHLMTLLEPGESIGPYTIPEGMVGFCTVCSITLNGVLLKYGIPTRSRFGGLLELKGGKATRFLEIITYEGTSIDPLEVFIRSGMTNYLGAIRDGNGCIGASFREIPAESRETVVLLAEKLDRIGLGAFMEIGRPRLPIYGIPVGEGHAGAVVVGGLNPISIVEEIGNRVVSRAMSGLLEYNRLFHYSEFKDRLRGLLVPTAIE